MNPPPFPHPPLVNCPDCQATFARLVANLSGFAYRRLDDLSWTMEFVSEGCRDVTGYDPHRFIGNASIAFADLIAPRDRARVEERVHLAVLHRHRATIEYAIRTAHGSWARVEDRLEGDLLFDSGILKALGEAIVEYARENLG